eukprot:5143373-Alexandrium_andersonii.AAC.1
MLSGDRWAIRGEAWWATASGAQHVGIPSRLGRAALANGASCGTMSTAWWSAARRSVAGASV